jgi:hypothetical protein
MNNFAAQGNSGMDWIFDSGASSHMSSSSNMLSNFSFTPFSSIILGNGSSIPIYCTGQTSIPTPTKSLLLHDVLIAPALIKNLISVRQFTRDNLEPQLFLTTWHTTPFFLPIYLSSKRKSRMLSFLPQ